MRYELLTEELEDQIAAADEDEQSYWLILDEHPDYHGFWIVQSLFPYFQFDFEDLIGPYRAVSPVRLGEFLDRCEESGYRVAFVEDPQTILAYYERLNTLPPFGINGGEGPIEGYYNWQIQGFNFLRDPDHRCGIARWDTGTGKTVLVGMLTRWHLMQDDFDLCLHVVKKNNRINTQRKLNRLFGLGAEVMHHYLPEKRLEIYEDFDRRLQVGETLIGITNYEKWREDTDYFKMLLHDRRVMIVWDEMPTRLRTRGTQLYDAVGSCLYKSWRKPKWHRKRPSWLRQYETTATPIERDPGDHFNCVRLLDPDVFGMTTEEFESEFVLSYNHMSKKPEAWHKLNKLGLKTAHITHDVSKDDPEVAQYFPDVVEEPVIIDWDDRDRAVYDILTGRAADLIEEDFGEDSVLTLINLMQMICDAPSMLNESADNRKAYEKDLEAFLEESGLDLKEPQRRGSEAAIRLLRGLQRRLTDSRHTKKERLREDLTKHIAASPENKAIVFTVYHGLLLPKMSQWLDEWGIKHVVFEGGEKKRQDAIDLFESDPEIKVFLGSDSASDSVDLPAANLVIHYDLPWLWARKIQRQNRAHRVISRHKKVTFLTYVMADSIEERKEELIMLRMGYHYAVFKGVIAERAFSARITKDELMWTLLGGARPESLA